MAKRLAFAWWSIAKAIFARDWHEAADLIESHHWYRSPMGAWISSLVGFQLTREAVWHVNHSNFLVAWSQLQQAQLITRRYGDDWVRPHKNEVLEAAVARADAALTAGEIETSLSIVRDLTSQKILDQRVDKIARSAYLIRQSERLARYGKFNDAMAKLALASRQHPALDYLNDRIQQLAQQKLEFNALINELRDAQELADPSRIHQLELRIAELSPEADEILRVGEIEKPEVSTLQAKQPTTTPESLPSNFMLWIDGVGGFLICCGKSLWLGRYVDRSNIDIPLQSDLLRRHANLFATSDGYSLVGTANTTVAGRSCETPQPLVDGDSIHLNRHVELKFRRPDWRSTSARIDFVTGHRTVPWCDAVLLLNDRLTIGPSTQNHVCVREMTSEITLRIRGGRLEVEGGGEWLTVDNQMGCETLLLHPNSRLLTEKVAMQFETLNSYSSG
ncbi:MAG: hypothetical protein ABL888_10380 [Pirellulaceae bacterium]